MRISNQKVLYVLIIASLCFIPVNLFVTGFLRTTLMLPLLLFFPGYAFLSVLFPGYRDLDHLARITFSFCMSIAVVPLMGLALNYSPWGLTPNSIVLSTALFVCIAAAIGCVRWQRLPQLKRLHFNLRIQFPNVSSMGTLQKALTILLVIAVLGAIGSLSYALVMPKEGERFTEFYILGPDGTVKNYPYEVTAGAPAQVTIGIVNHEYRSIKYRVEIQVDNGLIGQQVTEALDHNQKWETTASFTINTAGKNQRIKFYLYKDGELSSLFKEPLWLVVNVTPPK